MKKIYFIVLVSLFSCQVYGAQAVVSSVDFTRLNVLQGQLRQYYDTDDQLKELHDVFKTQKEQLVQYNTLQNNMSSGSVTLNSEQLAVIQRPSFQDLMQVSNTEVERLSQLSSIIIQGKNIDPSWQIAKYGPFFGSLSFMKNLFIPRDAQAYICAGIGALTGFVLLKNQQKSSPTIQINVPDGASNITIKDDTQQKLAATVAVCALGAGGVVAGAQLYNSWMYEKNSRDALTDKIRAIKNSNAQIGFVFDTIGLHNAIDRQEQAIKGVSNKVDQANNGIKNLQEGMVSDRNAATDRHNAVSGRFDKIENQIELVYQKIDTLSLDQQKFQNFVTNLVTDSDKKLEQNHQATMNCFHVMKKADDQYRKETAVACQNLQNKIDGVDTKLTDIQSGIVQGQNRLEQLIIQGQSSNKSQLPYAWNSHQIVGGIFYQVPMIQNSNNNNNNNVSDVEEVD